MSKSILQSRADLFAQLAPSPAEHFKLCFYAAVLRVIKQCFETLGSRAAAFEQFPFLAGYNAELAAHAVDELSCEEACRVWDEGLRAWEDGTDEHLPLRALREEACLDRDTLSLMMCVGLVEEDARFGLLFALLQGTPEQHRPTTGLLNQWWRRLGEDTEARAELRRLRELGLLEVVNEDAPRVEWAWQLPGLLWDALRGDAHEELAPWLRYTPPAQLLSSEELVVRESLQDSLKIIPALLESGEAQTLVVRGPQHNGRRTVLGAVAREMGCGLLEAVGVGPKDDGRWRLVGPLATALDALPVLVLDLGPGETVQLPRLKACAQPLCVVLGKQGGLSGQGAERALTLTLEMPGRAARRTLWQRSLGARGATDADELEQISERFRITSGNINRAAGLAQAYASLGGHKAVAMSDAQQASRALNRQALDTLAMRVEASGDWQRLAASDETMRELRELESRCRHRERLHEAVGFGLSTQSNSGVRALFTGPSGTGKTLAARLLASTMQMDLYRLDLSLVVNKYIGETEKNLNRIFARAEELDVILLLDEGDALLTQRTSVQTSNDRYANLETNYLLQRLETYEGILIVTTNAGDRIDTAFQRRMDIVVDFRAPEAAERWAIWQLHLPQAHTVDDELLDEVAERCVLSGGQIRNAVLHASLLALDDGGAEVNSTHLLAAVRREYRKAGAVCPLRL
ncbi:MAG TPA: ATP-binding protein [Pyrinomonadaceae bacterium]|jgi:hypothetical protein